MISGHLVKIFMRLPDGNISTAHPSVPYNGSIRQHDSLLARRMEITVRCLYPCAPHLFPDRMFTLCLSLAKDRGISVC